MYITTLAGLHNYLTLVIKEARNMHSSAEVCLLEFGTNSLSSATEKAAFFPSLEDLYRRKFRFFVYTPA